MRLLDYITIIRSMPEFFSPTRFADNKKLLSEEDSKAIRLYIKNKLFGGNPYSEPSFPFLQPKEKGLKDNKKLPPFQFTLAKNINRIGLNCFVGDNVCIWAPGDSLFCFPSEFEYSVESQLNSCSINAVKIRDFDAKEFFDEAD